jgi:hypothetical protein
MSNAPVKKLRIGLVTATVWKNEGQEKPFYTVQLQRQYKDAEGNWKAGDNLNHDDLLNAARVLTRAEAWIAEQ